jgi:hypothetical protein
MILVGISGAIDHGKTTLADYLGAAAPSAAHFESSDIIMEVANGLRKESAGPAPDDVAAIQAWLKILPQVLRVHTRREISFYELQLSRQHFEGAPHNFTRLLEYLALMQSQPSLRSDTIDISNKDIFRPLLVWLGGYLAKTVSGRLWFNEIVRRAGDLNVELVTAGGVRFPDDAACLQDAGGIILNIQRPDNAIQDLQDITESERELINPNVTVINDGSLVDLQVLANAIYQDLVAGELHSVYQASTLAV